jgi:Carbohydrate family 9 binding domain-like
VAKASVASRTRWRGARLVAVVALAVAVCCVDRGAGPQLGADDALVARSQLRQIPAALTPRLDAGFVGADVQYLGNLVDREVIAPGQPFEVRHFWRVRARPRGDLRIFTALRGEAGSGDGMSLDTSPLRRAHPLASWRAGEILEDVQQVTLRADWRSRTATLLVGLTRGGGHALSDRLEVHNGPARGRAVLARQLVVDLSQAPPPPGTWRAVAASAPIVIDGVADETTWRAAPWSADFPTAEGSRDPLGRARAKLAWDDRALYAFVAVEDRDIATPYRGRDEPLWKGDCVELFIDADGNQRQYVELQVNPWNAQFDSYFATTRAQPGQTEFDAGMTSQVVVHGTVNQQDDTDVGWDVELAIPWAAVRGLDPAMPVRLPPQSGDRFRLNLVRVDKRAGDTHPTASSWNRITYGDFHALDRMLTVVFSAPPGAAAPTEPSSPGAAPGSIAAPPPAPMQGAPTAPAAPARP